MKNIVGAFGFLVMIQGAAGLVQHWAGWFDAWTIVHRLGFLDGYEVVANIGLILIGFGIAVASDKIPD